MKTQKKLKSIEYRRQAEVERFRKAGMAPIQKTYSYNPKKVKQPPK
jgi:hypothetical protein